MVGLSLATALNTAIGSNLAMKSKPCPHTRLMLDHGYRYLAGALTQAGIRGFTSDRPMGRFPSALAAAEHLCPIIKQGEYTRRLVALSRPA
jgi:hypothetical protein